MQVAITTIPLFIFPSNKSDECCQNEMTSDKTNCDTILRHIYTVPGQLFLIIISGVEPRKIEWCQSVVVVYDRYEKKPHNTRHLSIEKYKKI